jgi:hypothetical protein
MFWMVVGGGVSRKFDDEEAARKHAGSLAMNYPGSEFTVMVSVATVKKSDVSWDMHHEEVAK